MQKIIVYDIENDTPVEVVYKEDPMPWIDEQISEQRWGGIDDARFEITECDSAELLGVFISEDAPDNPINKQLWLDKEDGILYSWNTESQKWLSVDRAAFIPVENMRSEHNG